MYCNVWGVDNNSQNIFSELIQRIVSMRKYRLKFIYKITKQLKFALDEMRQSEITISYSVSCLTLSKANLNCLQLIIIIAFVIVLTFKIDSLNILYYINALYILVIVFEKKKELVLYKVINLMSCNFSTMLILKNHVTYISNTSLENRCNIKKKL